MTDYRAVVRNVPIVTVLGETNHTHARAAGLRTQGNTWADRAIASIGHVPYSISCSSRDIRNGNSVSREIYFSKDVTINGRNDPIKQHHAFKLVDVDYYVDMPRLLSKFKPVFLYTFVPEKVAGPVFNGTFYIQDDKVMTFINGGAHYAHTIWDYDHDSIQVDFWWGSVIYLVEQKYLGDQRRVFFLNPSRCVFGPFAWFLPGYRLVKTKYTFDGINILRTQSMRNDVCESFLSIANNGSRSALRIREDLLIAATIRCNLSKDPSISDVERIFRSHSQENPDLAAAIFIQAYKTNRDLINETIGTVTIPPYCDETSFSYQTLKPLVTEDGTPCARQIGKPFLDTGFVPNRSHNNDTACVKGRIETPRNNVTRIPPFYLQCRSEFVKLLIPDELVHTYAPESEFFVETKQNRPTQRALADRAKPFSFLHKFVVKAFQKAEIYGKVGFPRNISTVPTDHKLRFSAFTYPLASLVKSYPWYVFGLNPREVTDAVCSMAGSNVYLTSNDFSHFDGSHGSFKTELDQQIFLRLYAKQYHEELSELLKSMTNASASTSTGVQYNTGHSVLSGAAHTSICNTTINALIAFISLRLTGLSAQEAWNNLGLYGGDDNLNQKIPEAVHIKVCGKLGYHLKTTRIMAGHPVTFLGRVFIDPWSTGASICDVPRRARTLHLTTIMTGAPDDVILHRRALSYKLTDPNTPIISNWSDMVLRCTKDRKGFSITDKERPWLFDADNNWTKPNSLELDYARLYISQELGGDVIELTKMENSIDQMKHYLDPHGCLRSSRLHKIDAVVGRDLVLT